MAGTEDDFSDVKYVLDNPDGDGLASFDPPDDLSAATKTTLADYLNKVVSDAKANVFDVSNKSSTTTANFNVSAEATPPIQTGGSSDAGTDTFFNHLDSKTTEQFSSVDPAFSWNRPVKPGSSWPPNAEEGAPFIDKSLRSLVNNLILAEVKANEAFSGEKLTEDGEGDTKLQKNISSVLKYNRFNPSGESPYIQDGRPSARGEDDTQVLFYVQGLPGQHLTDETAVGVTKQQLQNVAMKLMLNATGHDTEGVTDVDALVLPTFDQLGLTKVNVNDLNAGIQAGAQGILGELNEGGPYAIPDSEFTLGTRESFGQMNSPNEPFSGVFPMGMMFLALTSLGSVMLMFYVIQLVVSAFSSILGDFSPVGDGDIGTASGLNVLGSPPSTWKGVMGEHAPQQDAGGFLGGFGNKILELFGIPHLHHEWSACVSVGIEAFYGMDDAGLASFMATGGVSLDMSSMIDMAQNLMMSSGYYASVMRSVGREAADIGGAFESASFTSVTGGIGAILTVINTIVESATWKWLMVMAGVGDKVIDAKSAYFSPYDKGVPAEKLSPAPVNRIAKSKSGKGKDELIWSSNRALSLFLLPDGLQAALQYSKGLNLVGSDDMSPSAGVALIQGLQLSTAAAFKENSWAERGALVRAENGIIDPSYVKKMEAYLDGEFCPFYFHDLRTNEIIAFHAFITNLNESFSPNWNASSAYGRMDDVMTLQNTTRSLSLSFVVASTNPHDQSGMWYKINKLIAMLYPQWSSGKQMQTPGGDGQIFTMPFSQIPTGSPVVRLRIGDLVSSNYSRFGLARLFGLGSPAMMSSFSGEETTASDIAKSSQETMDKEAKDIESFLKAVEAENGKLPADTELTIDSDMKMVEVQELFAIQPKIIASIPKGTHVKVVGSVHRDTGLSFAMPAFSFGLGGAGGPEPPDPTPPSRVGSSGDWIYVCELNSPVFDAKGGTNKVKDSSKQYEIRIDPMKQPLKFRDGYLDELFAVKPDPAEIGLKNFFAGSEQEDTTKQNPIVRSFEATRGKGLAGVITSFDMSHNDAPWEDELGSKAPIWTTIDIAFQVIHDIAPGLAADGSLRAPSHPVGKVIKGTHGSQYEGMGPLTLKGISKPVEAQAEDPASNIPPKGGAGGVGA
jgi:hypothetical protein